MRPSSSQLCAALFVLATLPAGCSCSSKENSGNGTDGSRTDGHGNAPSEPRPKLSTTAPGTFLMPAGARVGQWVERRHEDRLAGRPWTERISVVGEEGDERWVEIREDRTAPGHAVVTRLLVRPDGGVSRGLRGFSGEKGGALRFVPGPPPVAAEPDETFPGKETVTTRAGSFECSVEIYHFDSEERRVYRSASVPYDGVVKIVEAEQVVELVAFGETGAASELAE